MEAISQRQVTQINAQLERMQQELDRSKADVKSQESSLRITSAHAKELEDRLAAMKHTQEEEKECLRNQTKSAYERLLSEKEHEMRSMAATVESLRTKYLEDMRQADARIREAVEINSREKDKQIQTT